MATLYEQAYKIYVWLGRPENELQNELAVQKMAEFIQRHIQSTVEDHPYRPWWWPHKHARYETDVYGGRDSISPNDKAIFNVAVFCDAQCMAPYMRHVRLFSE